MHTMASGLLSLKWNNHRSTFFHVLSSIRSKESYCDATLACDGRFYPVHKLVLSTCSEYFEQIFERTQCKHPVIVLKDIKYDDLEALMNYMYVGEVNVLQERLAGLIKAAECLKIKGLAVPDEDPSSLKERRNQTRDFDSPHAKRRRRDEPTSYDDRDRPVSSRTSRLGTREPQISHTDPLIPETSAVGNDLPESVTQDLENEPDCTNTDPRTHDSKSRSSSTASSSHRSSSHKQIHEVNIDEGSVKTEPPDIPDEVADNKETLHSDLGLDPGAEGESLSAGPASVASGSNDAGFSDSNAIESAPQSVEDVVAQALPPTSSNFQGGNSFPLWEGEGNMQNFPGEGYSGESNQGRPMMPRWENRASSADETGHGADSSTEGTFGASPEPQGPRVLVETSAHLRRSLLNPHPPPTSQLGPRHFPCPSCPKSFASPSALLCHQRVHTGEKPFSCSVCSYRTTQKGNLVTHMRTHTGEKPFVCTVCNGTFINSSNLKAHLQTKHDLRPGST